MQDYGANDVYVYIYVCVCVYYMQVYICVYMCILHASIYMCVYVYTTCKYIYICVYMCIILEKGMPTHSSNPCLENRMDRRAWQVTVHRVCTESDMTEAT